MNPLDFCNRSNIKGYPVTLQRGQLSYSIRYLAEAWRWKRQKAERFLNKLKTWSQIETATETGQQVITICNYSKYQDAPETCGTENGTEKRQQQDKSETNNKKIKEVNNLTADFEKFWKAYPRRKGSSPKKPAQDKFARIVKNGVSPQELIKSAETYAHEMRTRQKINTEYVAQAQTWLNQERWKDQLDTASQNIEEGPWSPF